MPRSIRWRLQVWYTLVLLAVIAGFAGILYYRVRAARLQEIDASLEAAAVFLDANLRRFPPHELDGSATENPVHPPPWSPGRPWPDEPPPRRPGGPPEDDDRPPRRPGGPPDGDGRPPPRRPGGPLNGDDWPPPRRPPPPGPTPEPPDRDTLLADLVVPARSDPRGGDRTYFAVWQADGNILKASDLPDGVGFPDRSVSTSASDPSVSQRGDNREAVLFGTRGTRILVGRQVRKEQGELRVFAWQLTGAGLVVLLVGLAGGWVISARILQPVAAISATASAISATNLSQRIDPEKVDRELTDLANILNAMFDRLEGAFERQTRFTADASHELRTPLAIIRNHAELSLSRPRSLDEYRETVATCLRASTRMTKLVEGLLTLARADAGKLKLQREPVDLKQVVEESIALYRPLAEGKGVSLTVRIAAAPVIGDPVRLGQVITNLLSNAVQYNRPGGNVNVQLGVSSGETVLSLADTGPGIPPGDCPHLFERFYRVDKARARASGGSGLGLAICKSIVEAHGGTIGFESEKEKGSTFWVRLPAVKDGNEDHEQLTEHVSDSERNPTMH